jgi:thiol-disulfide isomerase/thioredoxin
MKAPLLACICTVVLLTPAVAAEDTGYDALHAEFMKAWSAGSREDRAKLLRTYRPKFLAFATKNPRDPKAVAALCMTVQLSPLTGEDEARTTALAVLVKDHVKPGSVLLRRNLKMLAGRIGDDEAFELVRKVAAKNDDRIARAWAFRALIKGCEKRIELADRLEKDRTYRAAVARDIGEESVRRLIGKRSDNRLKIRQYRKQLDTRLPGIIPDLRVGKPAIELVCENLDGKKVKLSDLKGKVVVLDFWATWCGHCIKMIPHERELVKRLKGKPFVLVSISVDDSKDKVRRFLERTPMPWTHWYMGAGSELVDLWDLDALPSILVLDHKGVIRYKDVREQRMDDAVNKLLEEMEG